MWKNQITTFPNSKMRTEFNKFKNLDQYFCFFFYRTFDRSQMKKIRNIITAFPHPSDSSEIQSAKMGRQRQLKDTRYNTSVFFQEFAANFFPPESTDKLLQQYSSWFFRSYIVNIMKSFDNFDYLRSWLMGFTKSESKAFSPSSSSSSVNLLQKKSGFSKIKWKQISFRDLVLLTRGMLVSKVNLIF